MHFLNALNELNMHEKNTTIKFLFLFRANFKTIHSAYDENKKHKSGPIFFSFEQKSNTFEILFYPG